MNTLRLKILYVTHQFLPDYAAGTELLTYTVANQMRQRKHIINIISGWPVFKEIAYKKAFDYYLYDDLKVYRYYHSSFHPVDGQCVMEAEHNNRSAKNYFKNLLLKLKPDIVHVFHLKRVSASILEVCSDLGIPYVITVTDFWLICPTTQLLLPNDRLCKGPQKMMVNCAKHLADRASRPFISRIVNAIPDRFIRGLLHLLSYQPRLCIGPFANLQALMKRQGYILKQANNAKRIFVTNRFMRQMLVKNGILSNKITEIPFGINPINIPPRAPKAANDGLQVGFIGTLIHHKGAHIPIKAVRALPKSETLHLSIYGNRNQFPEYVSMLDRLSDGDSRIEFKGTFPSDQIGKILMAFDVLVLPSMWYENTPLILLQAQAANLPVIATNLGGMNEIVKNGINGFLIEPGDYQKLSSILESLLLKPEQISSLRQNIRKPIFIDEYAGLLEREYSELLGS